MQSNKTAIGFDFRSNILILKGCSSDRLSRTRASGPKTHFLEVKKWLTVYEF